MKILRKKIDLSEPHLIPDRLKRYVFNDVYPVVKKEKDGLQKSEVMAVWSWLLDKFEYLMREHNEPNLKEDKKCAATINRFEKRTQEDVRRGFYFTRDATYSSENNPGYYFKDGEITERYFYFQLFMKHNCLNFRAAMRTLCSHHKCVEKCKQYLQGDFNFTFEEVVQNEEKWNWRNLLYIIKTESGWNLNCLFNYANIVKDFEDKKPGGDLYAEVDADESRDEKKYYIEKKKRLKPLFVIDLDPMSVLSLDRELSKDHLHFLYESLREVILPYDKKFREKITAIFPSGKHVYDDRGYLEYSSRPPVNKIEEVYTKIFKVPETVYTMEYVDIDRYFALYPPINMVADIKFVSQCSYLYDTEGVFITESLGDAIWTTPFGGYHIPDQTDWRPAKDRDVYFFKVYYTDYKESLKALLRVYDAFRRDCPYNEHSHQNIRFILYQEKEELKYRDANISILASDEFLHKCYRVLGTDEIENYPNLQKELTLHLSHIRKSSKGKRFLIHPFLRPGNWGLLTGEAGTGKSYLSMALGMAVATKGKLPFGWEVQQKKCKVLYIDAEVDEEELAFRKKLMGQLYSNNKNFIIRSAHKVDLLTREGQELVENYIDKATLKGPEGAVKLLILDNLHNLSSNVGSTKENWPTISDWLDKLCERGLAVLLVHHEFMSGKMLGSTFIRNDAQSIVSVSNYEVKDEERRKKGLPLLARIIKNRSGYGDTDGKMIFLNLQPAAWLSDDICDEEDEKPDDIEWKKLTPASKREWVLALAVYQKQTVKETANFFGVSVKTIENARREYKIKQEEIAKLRKLLETRYEGEFPVRNLLQEHREYLEELKKEQESGESNESDENPW